MPKQENLQLAKKYKNDEFYTQYEDIQSEINAYLEYDPNTFKDKTVLLPCDDPEWSNFTRYFAQNFERLGLKKLISTSYAVESKPSGTFYQPTIFEMNNVQYDEVKTRKQGKIFTLTRRNKKVDINDLNWKYLDGDGDFRSDEVKVLRDEADIIVTNPPISLSCPVCRNGVFKTWLKITHSRKSDTRHLVYSENLLRGLWTQIKNC